MRMRDMAAVSQRVAVRRLSKVGAALAMVALAASNVMAGYGPAIAQEVQRVYDTHDGNRRENAKNCVSILECLTFVSEGQSLPKMQANVVGRGTTYDLVPILDAPRRVSKAAWQGTFLLMKHSDVVMHQVDQGHSETCLASPPDGSSLPMDGSCNRADPVTRQLWYLEPAEATVDSRLDEEGRPHWFPWFEGATGRSSARFHLRNLASRLCFATTQNGLRGNPARPNGTPDRVLRSCDPAAKGALAGSAMALAFYNSQDDPESELGIEPSSSAEPAPHRLQSKNVDAQNAISIFALASAIAHAGAVCAADQSTCAVQVSDASSGEVVSSWNRIKDVELTRKLTPYFKAINCAADNHNSDQAGPGLAQSIYNGGNSDMSTTVSASGSNSYSHSFNFTLSLMQKFGMQFGGPQAPVKGGFELQFTETFQWGHVWTESKTVTQSATWTIPARRYANAVLSSQVASLKARYRFGLGGASGVWQTDDFQAITIPYSTDRTETAPPTRLSIFNSLAPKVCTATAPSRLRSGVELHVENQTSADPSAAPVVGDVLTSNAAPGMWTTGDQSDFGHPAKLRYQWYRQRGIQAPIAIINANEPTYHVTADDVADETDAWLNGRFRLFVGVTDQADAYRFDSLEYRSVMTAPTATTRVEKQKATPLVTLAVRPISGVDNGNTEVEVRVRNPLTDAAYVGKVDLRVDHATVRSGLSTSSRGLVKEILLLPRGKHVIDLLVLGDGDVDAGESSSVSVDVEGASTAVDLRKVEDLEVGDSPELVAHVRSADLVGRVPTGSVVFYDGSARLGEVELASDGTATYQMPSLRAVGPHAFRARYSGDTIYAGSDSEAIELGVGVRAASVELESQAEVASGGEAQFTAVVRGIRGGAPDGGAVDFVVDGRQEGRVKVAADGRAHWSWRALGSNSHEIEVAFHPEVGSGWGAASSASARLSVIPRPTAVVAKPSCTKRCKRNSAVLSVSVDAAGAGAPRPTGRLQMWADGARKGGAVAISPGWKTKMNVGRYLRSGSHVIFIEYLPSASSSVHFAGNISSAVKISVRR